MVNYRDNEIQPPLGIMPKHLWMIQRKQELARAIFEYMNYDFNNRATIEWIRELHELSELIIDEGDK